MLTASRRSLRIGAGIVASMLSLGLLAPSQPAAAMTTTNASGLPGDSVTVSVRNERTQPNVTWVIRAPQHTTFASAPRSNNPPGTLPFTCPLASPTEARCGAGTFWAANNRVDAELAIDAAAPAGSFDGSSSLGSESAGFTVTVQPPPAPPVSAAAVTQDRTPETTGSKRSGNSVSLRLDGEALCSVTADAATSWFCAVADDLSFGEHSLTATQTSRGGDTSETTAVTITVIDQLTVSSPDDGDRTTDRTPTITGSGALPGVEVTIRAGDEVLTTTADDDGNWRTAAEILPVGSATISASWQVAGQTFAAIPASLTITIAPPPLKINTPADASTTYRPRPSVTGSGADPDANIEVELAGRTLTATATAAGTWSVQLPVDLSIGSYEIRARQIVNDVVSDAANVQFRRITLPPPTVATPTAGARVTDRRPVLSGRAAPRALVTLRIDGRRVTARVDSSGTWRTAVALSLGSHSISATQAVDGVTSVLSAVRTFRVIQAPPPEVAGTDSPDSDSTSNDSSDEGNTSGGSSTSSSETGDDSSPSGSSDRSTSPDTDDSPPGESAAQPNPGAAAPASPPAAANDYLPVSLAFGRATLIPGRVTSLVGTLGPNASDRPVTVTLTGSLNQGMLYRSVESDPAGTCTVGPRQFSCTIPLQPGQQATLQIRVLADAVKAPVYARQQLTVSTSDHARPNTMTQTTRIDAEPTETEQLAAAITKGPGTFVVLLTMYLFALAATEAERRRP